MKITTNHNARRTFSTVLGEVELRKKVLITTHKNPDPDAYGSAFGLKDILLSIVPEADIRVVMEESENLSSIIDVSSDSPFEDNSNLVFIAIDCAGRDRLSVEPFGDFIVKIDHHPITDDFETHAIVDTSRSSACELICSLFHDNFIRCLDDRAKLYLAFGMIGDTGRFLYNNTTEQTLHYASLVKSDIDWNKEIFLPMYSKPLSRAKMEGYIKSHMKAKNDVLYCLVLRDWREEIGASIEDTSNCVNEMANIEGFGIWVLIVEDDNGEFRLRLRSKEKHIHLIAQKYNGGGHPLASGVRTKDIETAYALLNDLASL